MADELEVFEVHYIKEGETRKQIIIGPSLFDVKDEVVKNQSIPREHVFYIKKLTTQSPLIAKILTLINWVLVVVFGFAFMIIGAGSGFTVAHLLLGVAFVSTNLTLWYLTSLISYMAKLYHQPSKS